MPRPKQNKFTAPLASTALSAVPRHISSPRSSQPTSTSDDSDSLVRKNKSGLNLHGIPRVDVFMGGALDGDRPERRRRPRRGVERVDPAKAARQADNEKKIAALKRRKEEAEARAGLAEEEVLVPASQPQRDERSKSPGPAPPQSPTIRQSPSLKARAQPVPTTAKKPRPPLAANWKAQATPSSVLSLAKFKRRPRENSILRIGPEDESLSLTSLGGGSDDAFGDLENMKPLDESTPFNVTKTRPQPSAPLAPLHKQAQSLTPSNLSTNGSRKRKSTPPEVLVAHSPSPAPSPQPSSREQGSEKDDESAQDEPTLPSPKRRALSPPELWSDTMAPPLSSSPSRPANTVTTENAHAPATRGRDTRDASTPPAQGKRSGRPCKQRNQTTSKPVKSKAAPPQPMSTSALQNLLPRRRITPAARDEFDLESSDVGQRESSPVDEDADELSFLPSKKKRPTAKQSTAKKPQSRPEKVLASKTPRIESSRTANSAAKGKLPAAKGKFPPSKTYAQRLSDKKNSSGHARSPTAAGTSSTSGDGSHAIDSPSVLETSSIADLPEKGRRQLRGLAKKFKEVDKWEMTFEQVTASSSSPRDAR